MLIKRLFVDQRLTVGQTISLEKNQAHYLLHVLRVQTGTDLILFNGDNYEYTAHLLTLTKHQATLKVTEKIFCSRESKLNIHLGQVLTKGDKMDLILQKATELGVYAITPLLSEYANVKLNAERMAKKQTHWQKILQATCMQCGRNQIPVLHTNTTLLDWFNQCQQTTRFIFHPDSKTNLTQIRDLLNPKTTDLAVVIGPEGGFSKTELSVAENNGFKSICLGTRILRTETAALAAISCLQLILGDF